MDEEGPIATDLIDEANAELGRGGVRCECLAGGAGSRKGAEDQFVFAYSILGPVERGATRGCGVEDEEEEGARLEEEEDSSDDGAVDEEAEAERLVEKLARGMTRPKFLCIAVRPGAIILADMLGSIAVVVGV